MVEHTLKHLHLLQRKVTLQSIDARDTIMCYFVLVYHIKCVSKTFKFVIVKWQNVKKIKAYEYCFKAL